MIVYDTKKWNKLFLVLIKTFKESYNLQQLGKFIFIAFVYSTGVTIVNLTLFKGDFAIDTSFFSLMGVILSLFLVFRLNSAYDRWWEGRKSWGKLVNDCRTLSMNLNSLLPQDDKQRRKFFVKNIANFCMALKWHLRDEDSKDQLIHINFNYTDDLEKALHIPNRIASFMFNEVELMYKEGAITDFDKDRIKNILQGLIDVLGVCERIKNTPIPFSHSTFIKLFTIIYIAILPFGLVDSFGYFTIPASVIMAFAMLGIEVISEEIENPFGYDANDLPTTKLSDNIRENVYDILQVKSTFRSQYQTEKEADVIH